jgi:hypothetical protein
VVNLKALECFDKQRYVYKLQLCDELFGTPIAWAMPRNLPPQ